MNTKDEKNQFINGDASCSVMERCKNLTSEFFSDMMEKDPVYYNERATKFVVDAVKSRIEEVSSEHVSNT